MNISTVLRRARQPFRSLYAQRPMCTHKNHLIIMPQIMDSKSGVVEKWLKKEGESYKKGESLCEMALVPSDLLVAVDAEEAGILAKILIPAGKSVPVNDPIAIFVHTQDDYFSYIEDQRIADADSHRHAVTEEVLEAATKRPDAKVLLRHVKHMIQSGDIEEGSEFAKKLSSLARKGNQDLMATFEASFEGVAFNVETFDTKFFLENAQDIVKEHDEEKEK